jgi:hypothetical protein
MWIGAMTPAATNGNVEICTVGLDRSIWAEDLARVVEDGLMAGIDLINRVQTAFLDHWKGSAWALLSRLEQ